MMSISKLLNRYQGRYLSRFLFRDLVCEKRDPENLDYLTAGKAG